MNYHQYYPVDVVNGPGTRCTLFVAGCEHKCRGCYNATTWRVDSGKPFDQQMENRIIQDLKETTNKDIWLWTGYTLGELSSAQLEIVDKINTLIDGKFIQELKDPALVWRGSSNQIIHFLR